MYCESKLTLTVSGSLRKRSYWPPDLFVSLASDTISLLAFFKADASDWVLQ